ncbi:MAG: hypothetical protein IT366_23795 [Candidatus Hydrogenedentes bacterium]|nr:hypothetical protein [Candidatus Hydrogenedentota bacterium]
MRSMLSNRLIWCCVPEISRASLVLVFLFLLSSCGGYTRLAIKSASVSQNGKGDLKLLPADVPIQSISQSISENYASLTTKFQEVQFDNISVTVLHAISGENLMDAADRIDLDIAITNKKDEAIKIDWRSIALVFEDPLEMSEANKKTTRFMTFRVNPSEVYILARDSGDESKVGKPFIQNGETIHFVSQKESARDRYFTVHSKTTGKLDIAFYKPCPRKAELTIGLRLTPNDDVTTIKLQLAPK